METITNKEFIKRYVKNGLILPNKVSIFDDVLKLVNLSIVKIENIPDSIIELNLEDNKITEIEIFQITF